MFDPALAQLDAIIGKQPVMEWGTSWGDNSLNWPATYVVASEDEARQQDQVDT